MCVSTSTFTTGMSALGIVTSAAGGAYTAYNQIREAENKQDYYNFVADQNEFQGRMAIKQGDIAAQGTNLQALESYKTIKKSANKVKSSQIAAMAANGVYLDSGSAEDVVISTMNEAQKDEEVIRRNAMMKMSEQRSQAALQSSDLNTQAAFGRLSGVNERAAGYYNAGGTLLNTFGSVADKWLKYSEKKNG